MIDLDAYCARIGYAGPRVATLEVLRAMHALQPAAIPFEAIDVILDRGVDLTPSAIDAKLIDARRGGYCYEQNSLFKRALERFGFVVEGLIARVRWNLPPDAQRPRTHMALRVRIDDTEWLADVGFGGLVLTAPLRFNAPQPQDTLHERYRLVPLLHGHRLEAELGDTWVPLYELSAEPQIAADYDAANWFSAKHPSSHFRHNLIVARTTPDARYNLIDNRLTTRERGHSEQRWLDLPELGDALRDVFTLPVEDEWSTQLAAAVARGNAVRQAAIDVRETGDP